MCLQRCNVGDKVSGLPGMTSMHLILMLMLTLIITISISLILVLIISMNSAFYGSSD